MAVGHLRLRAFWTPGHTPEHLGYVLIDPDAGPDPIALFSGDVLFVGEMGGRICSDQGRRSGWSSNSTTRSSTA